jgi:RNA polymerase sigma-70 factor (ECF subfamily)
MTPEEQLRQDRFLRLFLEHEESLRGFVRSLVPDREEAREVMQEVAAVLWRKFDVLESPGDFRRWAFGVARLEALAAVRDRARDRLSFSEELLGQLAMEAEEAADDFAAEREMLARCMQKLPEHHRVLIATAYDRETRLDELAARMGRTAMSLYKALHRIRLVLLKCVRQELAREALE